MITSNSFKTPVKKDEPVQVENPQPETLDTTEEETVE